MACFARTEEDSGAIFPFIPTGLFVIERIEDAADFEIIDDGIEAEIDRDIVSAVF